MVDTLARTTMFGYFIERWSENELRDVTICAFDEFGKAGNKFEEPILITIFLNLSIYTINHQFLYSN